MKRFWLGVTYWLPPVLLMGLIFYLSSRSAFAVSPKDWLNFLFFKSMHFLEYTLLFILFYRALKNTVNKNDRFFWGWCSVVLSFLWAVIDEIHQLYIPTRQGSLRDILIDTLGISFGLICLWIILPRVPGKPKNWAKKLGLL